MTSLSQTFHKTKTNQCDKWKASINTMISPLLTIHSSTTGAWGYPVQTHQWSTPIDWDGKNKILSDPWWITRNSWNMYQPLNLFSSTCILQLSDDELIHTSFLLTFSSSKHALPHPCVCLCVFFLSPSPSKIRIFDVWERWKTSESSEEEWLNKTR